MLDNEGKEVSFKTALALRELNTVRDDQIEREDIVWETMAEKQA